MLPNLVEYNKPISEFLIKNLNLNRLTELSIYIFTLIGFSVYYGLDLLAEGEGMNNNRMSILHLGMFCLYNFLMTYTMSLRAQAGILATILFTFAMALHFVFTDQKFCRLYPLRFRNLGRFILIVALLFGWLCSVIFNPVNVLVSAFMLSFLAGSVLLNVFREELPASNLTRYSWFIAGVMLIAVILLLNASLVGQAKSL
jgi:hypothetical protein